MRKQGGYINWDIDDIGLGFIYGLFLACMVAIFASVERHDPIEELKQQCEQSLPRSQVCVMQFVPEETK